MLLLQDVAVGILQKNGTALEDWPVQILQQGRRKSPWEGPHSLLLFPKPLAVQLPWPPAAYPSSTFSVSTLARSATRKPSVAHSSPSLDAHPGATLLSLQNN